jgi:hypothetical protein
MNRNVPSASKDACISFAGDGGIDAPRGFWEYIKVIRLRWQCFVCSRSSPARRPLIIHSKCSTEDCDENPRNFIRDGKAVMIEKTAPDKNH